MLCLLCLLLPLPETSHFHLRAGGLPCNLHLCSDSGTAGLCLPEQCMQGAEATLKTKVGCGTEGQGRVIPFKQAQGSQCRMDTGTPQPSLSFPRRSNGQYPAPAQYCSDFPEPCEIGPKTEDSGG